MSKYNTENKNKDISHLKNDILYDSFENFYKSINFQFSVYHSKYVSNLYNIPRNLQLSIDNYSHFVDTFEALVKNKLYIHSIENYDHDRMFYDYILPTSIFLHYLNVDTSKMSEINLYIVNDKLYSLYRREIGGEYTQGIYRKSNIKNHIILIKDYTEINELNHALTLISLFHELTHLVDNSDFNGLQQDKIIGYSFRWSEIKAKYLSEFFYMFYKCLTKYVKGFTRLHLINQYSIPLKDNLNDLYLSIVNNLELNEAIIDLDISYDDINDNTMELTQENIQYYTSLQQINDLNKFFKNVEGILK